MVDPVEVSNGHNENGHLGGRQNVWDVWAMVKCGRYARQWWVE